MSSNKQSELNSIINNQIEYIEKLLQTPIHDCRKLVIELILVPYLILVKRLSSEEIFTLINEWLQKCDSIRKLNFNSKFRINSAIKISLKKKIPPMSKYTLETNYNNLYLLINSNKKGESS